MIDEKQFDELMAQLPDDSPKTAKFRNQYEIKFEFPNDLNLLGIEFTRIIGLNYYKDKMAYDLLTIELRKQFKELVGEKIVRINSFVRINDENFKPPTLTEQKDDLVL